MRLEVLTVDQSTGCRSYIAVTVSVESRLAEISGHGTVGQQPALKLELLHLLPDASLLFACQLSNNAICPNSCLTSAISCPVRRCNAALTALLHRKVLLVQNRTTLFVGNFCLPALPKVEQGLTSVAEGEELGLNVFPLNLHWGDQRAILTALVYASFLFDWLIENSRSLAEQPELSLLLVKVWVHFSFFCANGSFLAGSRPVLYLSQLFLAGQTSCQLAKELFIHSLITDLSFFNGSHFEK